MAPIRHRHGTMTDQRLAAILGCQMVAAKSGWTAMGPPPPRKVAASASGASLPAGNWYSSKPGW
eukprot:7752968-Alexandrium_andersonii.AAC.1